MTHTGNVHVIEEGLGGDNYYGILHSYLVSFRTPVTTETRAVSQRCVQLARHASHQVALTFLSTRMCDFFFLVPLSTCLEFRFFFLVPQSLCPVLTTPHASRPCL